MLKSRIDKMDQYRLKSKSLNINEQFRLTCKLYRAFLNIQTQCNQQIRATILNQIKRRRCKSSGLKKHILPR